MIPRDELAYELFQQARQLPLEQRRDYLRVQCGDDAALLAEVERRLAASAPPQFMEPPRDEASVAAFFGRELTGRRLGQYRLLREIGRGGMGVVYLAEDEKLDRHIAVKVLPTALLAHPEASERFRREARAASLLSHPCIVPIHAFSEDQELAWIAMRYVEGHDLQQEIALQKGLGREDAARSPILPAFDSPEYVGVVAALVAELFDALEHAHQNGIIHRDVKPQNVLLDRDGRAYLVDFGLARDERQGSITHKEQVQGTTHYMSPEQARLTKLRIDHRTDVYSLSVVLYELLSLQRPFEGPSSREILDKIATQEPSSLRRLNGRVARDLGVVCAKGMSKHPSQRYASAQAARDDLRRFLRHESIVARPPSWSERAVSWMRRHPTAIAVSATGIAALVIGSAVRAEQQRRVRVRQQRSVLERALAARPWSHDASSVALLIEPRRVFRDLTESGGAVDSELAPLLAALEVEFQTHKEGILAAGLSQTWAGRGGSMALGPYRSAPSERNLGEGLRVIADALALYGDDPEILRAADVRTTYPTLTVDLSPITRADLGDAPGIHVEMWSIDPITGSIGSVVDLGPLPISELPVAPGWCRIVVDVPGYGYSEHTRCLAPLTEPEVISARVRPTAEVLEGMKLIGSGTLRFDAGCRMGGSFVGNSSDVEEFYLDVAETSNDEYLRFLQETSPAMLPKAWRECGYETDRERFDAKIARCVWPWGELPVVGMNWHQARDFVEWSGKRLPQHFELEWAQRGLGLALTSWDGSADPSEVEHANVRQESRNATGPQRGLPVQYDIYLRNAKPVSASAYFQRMSGLFHAFGNVAEFTESPHVEVNGGMLFANPWERVYFGQAWDADGSVHTLASHPFTGTSDSYVNCHIGIRCAKSRRN